MGAASAAIACGTDDHAARADGGTPAPPDSVADSLWVTVRGPTLIAFHPIRSNEQLAQDEGLAMALDDLAYHIGTAMDSLNAAGVAVHYVGGDTVRVRAGGDRWRFVRDADSASMGYVWTDAQLRHAVVYGVRSYTELVESARQFVRTGRLGPD